MKKFDNNKKTGIIFGAVVAALVLSAVLIAGLLIESGRIRKFKVDVFVLCNESDICVANGPDGTVKVHQDNLPAIYNILQKSHGKTKAEAKEPSNSISLEFKCHDEAWIMTVDEIDTEVLKISLSGPEEKEMYFTNKGAFGEYARAVSLKGYNTPNKSIGK
ncbi:MAG: hypothetical protein J6O49_17785 [Bacteroidaceae bacterium]|nr:hypothetical protein [Bacteroidaceae bacterium]